MDVFPWFDLFAPVRFDRTLAFAACPIADPDPILQPILSLFDFIGMGRAFGEPFVIYR